MPSLEQIQNATKDAMRARDQRRVNALRLMASAIKQQEIDSRTETSREGLTDEQILTVLERMVKQRQDAHQQYEGAGRHDLAAQESFEINVIREFMPTQLSEQEIRAVITEAINVVQPRGAVDMGKVMTYLKPRIQGRADMRLVSELIKDKLK